MPRVELEMTVGKPASFEVGTSGRNFERASSITMSARTSPDLTRGTMLPTLSKATSMFPPMISLNCVAPPSRCTMR